MDTLVGLGILLLIAGFILVGVEMAIPGFGAPGISGIACLVGGILLTSKSIEQGLTITMIVVVKMRENNKHTITWLRALPLAMMLVVILLTLKKVKPPFILEDELKAEGGYLNDSDLEYLVGKEGTAATDLKPAGKCDIEGVEFDVRAEGRYVKKGTKVRISRIHENTIMIKEI